MSTGNKQLDDVINFVPEYQNILKTNASAIRQARAENRSGLAHHYQAVEDAVLMLDDLLEEFFDTTATLEHFASWDTAGPLYRAGWNEGRVCRVFLKGFKQLLDSADTYLSPNLFVWTFHPDDRDMESPVRRMVISLPSHSVNEDKLQRTAEVADKLFVPMTEAHPELRISFEFETWGNSVILTRDSTSGQYLVHPYGPGSTSFKGSLYDALDHVVNVHAHNFIGK